MIFCSVFDDISGVKKLFWITFCSCFLFFCELLILLIIFGPYEFGAFKE